jgi:hypothetical protein
VNVASIGGKIAVPHLLPYSVVGAGLDKTRYISTIRAAVRHAPTGAAGRWAD